MSLDHRFGLVETSLLPPQDRKRWKNPTGLEEFMAEQIELHDDLLRYIGDTLRWVPCYNPCTSRRHFGLNVEGITCVTRQGASKASKVFDSWADLLDVGPAELCLTGCYTFLPIAGSEGSYAELRFNRDETVGKLALLAARCRQVARSNGNTYLLHLGI